MKFIKSLFGSKDPREEVREKLLELELPDTAIYLPEAIEEEDFNLVRDVAEELVEEGKYKGMLVGKKGWFLPEAEKKLEQVWKQLEKGKIDLEEVAKDWDINEKRVYIALEDYAEKKDEDEPIFHREGMDLYFVSYFKKAWYDVVTSIDEDLGTDLQTLIDKARVTGDDKEIFRELVEKWLSDPSSSYAVGSDGVVRPKRAIPELIEEYVPSLWEEGKEMVTYEELAKKYGMTRKEIGGVLQDLIDDRALGDVILYATDEMIKPRP